jgi:hypothetical protein
VKGQDPLRPLDALIRSLSEERSDETKGVSPSRFLSEERSDETKGVPLSLA